MPFQVAAELAQRKQFLSGEQAGLGPRSIQQWRSVALRENEPVVDVIKRIFRVIPHVSEEQRGYQIRGRTTRSGMSAPRRRRCRNRMNAQLIGDYLQTFDVNIVHEWRKLYSANSKRKVETLPHFAIAWTGVRVSIAASPRAVTDLLQISLISVSHG